jgi:iron complex outermembrane receptor protein
MNPAKAQQESDTVSIGKVLDKSEVIITAQRVPVMGKSVARSVTVLTSDEIAKMPVNSLDALLEFVPGIDIRQRGINHTQADISIRGGSFDQTLVLLNGVNISDPQTGHHNLNIPVHPSWIEKVEVLRGPAARVFGPNAFNGVINIITKSHENNNINGNFIAGDFATYSAGLSVSVNSKKVKSFLGINHSKSDGYTSNTDYLISNGFASASFQFKKIRLSVNAGALLKEFGANSFYSPKYPNQFEETKTYFTSLTSSITGRFSFNPAVYVRRNLDKFMLFRNESPTWYKSHNYHCTDIAGVTLPMVFVGKLGKTAFGGDFRYEHLISNVLGNDLAEPILIANTNGLFYTKGSSRSQLNTYLEHSVYLGRLYLSGGLLYGYNSELNKWKLYPGLDINLSLLNNLEWYASTGKTLRMPTFTDLFYVGPTNIGNPNLAPEEAWAVETGLKFKKNAFKLTATTFYNHGTNMIDWVKQPGDEKWQSVNLTEVNTFGVEGSIEYKTTAKETWFHINSANLGVTFLNTSKSSGLYVSKYVLDALKHKVTLAVNQTMLKKLSLAWLLQYQQRAGTYTDYREIASGSEKSYEPVLTLDGRFSFQHKALGLFADVSNAFNNSYYDHGGVPQPGRLFSIGLTYRLL